MRWLGFKLILMFSLLSPVGASELQDLAENLDRGIAKAPLDSRSLPSLYEEQQKIFYRLENWERFFANARFYRARYLSLDPQRQSKALRNHFREKMLALEILALAKHCQWEVAQTLATNYMSLAQQLSLPHPSLRDAQNLVALHETFPQKNKPDRFSARPQNLFSVVKSWRIEGKHLARLAHPQNLRVHVASRCQAGDHL